MVKPIVKTQGTEAGLFAGALLILLVCAVTAVGVVYTDYVARSHFIRLQEMVEQESLLKVEAGRLLLEEGSYSSLALVEKKARNELMMQVPLTEQIQITYTNNLDKQKKRNRE